MIYITRHGQTDMNKAMQMQGHIDCPLNETGREQAAELGRFFAERGITFDFVYSSPLIRAVETAKTAVDTDDVIIDKRLIEMDYGPYEGMDMRNIDPEVMDFFRDFVNVPAPDGMEQLSDVVARLGDFVESIKALAAERNILIATHAIAMKGLLEYLTPESQGGYWSKFVGNCDVYVAEVVDGEYTVPVALE